MSEKQKRINLAGWKQCGAFLQAKTALSGLQVIFPQKYAVNITECTLPGRPAHATCPVLALAPL
jgi:hypothetical protein